MDLSAQLRIVLMGKTGNGKSSTGNGLLLSHNAFRSLQSARSITKDCQVQTVQRTDGSGRTKQVLVVDTPGFFDTDGNITNEVVEKKIASQIFEMTSPGVHAFLIILRIGRFSPEERNTVDYIRTIFGPNAANYCIVIFTHEDQLEDVQAIDDFISSSPALQELINICGNRKLAINNRLTGERLERKTQQLLGMIQEMVNINNGTYYTNEEYERIERQRLEEKQRLEKEECERREAYEKKLKEEAAAEENRKQNQLISETTETRTITVGVPMVTPIMSRERKRRGGFGRVVSIGGSGYKYYDVQVGTRITTRYRKEQRQVKTFYSGRQEFGDWRVIEEWNTTS